MDVNNILLNQLQLYAFFFCINSVKIIFLTTLCIF